MKIKEKKRIKYPKNDSESEDSDSEKNYNKKNKKKSISKGKNNNKSKKIKKTSLERNEQKNSFSNEDKKISEINDTIIEKDNKKKDNISPKNDGINKINNNHNHFHEKLSKEDKEILDKTNNKTRIIVVNKVDLEEKIDLPKELDNVVYTSTIKDNGVGELKNLIKKLFNIEKIKTKDSTYLSNSRQISLAKQALKSLESAEKGIEEDIPIDMIEIDLKETFDLLGNIIGIEYSEEIIDNLFKNFCVGK